MKTNHPLHSSQSRWVTTLLVTATMIGLMLNTTALLAAPGGGSNTSIPLIITFDPGGSIRGDGAGTVAYTSGIDKVLAVINSTGQMDFNTNNGEKPTGRRLHIDLSVAVTGSVSSCGASGGFPDYDCDGQADDPKAKDVYARILTLNDTTLANGIINLRTLQPGAFARGGLAINFSDECSASTHVPWRIRFLNTQDAHYPPCAVSTVRVRVEAQNNNSKSVASNNTADTWLITPEAVSGQASLFSGGTGEPVLREIVQVPFIMTVTLK